MEPEKRFRRDWKSPVVIVCTGLGTGFTPIMPGTVTSLVAMLYWWYFVADLGWVIQGALLVGTYVVAYLTISQVRKQYGLGDHGSITIDEVVGQWTALFMLPQEMVFMVGGFLLFRGFDILKLGVIGKVEKVGGAHGVILDDLLAGLVACVLLNLLHFGGEYWKISMFGG